MVVPAVPMLTFLAVALFSLTCGGGWEDYPADWGNWRTAAASQQIGGQVGGAPEGTKVAPRGDVTSQRRASPPVSCTGETEDVPSAVEGGMATPMFIHYPTFLC